MTWSSIQPRHWDTNDTWQKLIDSMFVYTTDIIQDQKFNGKWQMCVYLYMHIDIRQVYMYEHYTNDIFCDGVLHWLNAIYNDMEPFYCGLCQHTFTNKDSLCAAKHKEKCIACNFSFSSADSIQTRWARGGN